tara:strand:- start:624470 stop:626491 length:2022 start_codon:yes stop_codon:yes gene_type:complete
MKTISADLSDPIKSFDDLYEHLCLLSDVAYLREQKIENYISEKVRVVGEIRRLADATTDPKVLTRYAELILNKAPHLPHDITEAENSLIRASDAHYVRADFLLMNLYINKYGYDFDPESYRDDVENHLNILIENTTTPYAAYYLASFYRIIENHSEAMKYLDVALAANLPEALAFKAHAHFKGDIEGIEKDGKKSYALYRKAYERCVALGEEALDKPHLKYEILYHLGCMYINGWGVVQNGHTGRCLVFKAAEKNDTAKKYCSQFLSMTNEEWYQRLQEDVKNLDIDSLFEGGSPALDFCKSNRNTNANANKQNSESADDAAQKPVVVIDEHDIFDPMAIFLDPNAKIEIREYNGEDEYDLRGKEDDIFKADRRSPKVRLDPLTKDKIDEIFKPLDQLVGLGHIKQEVRSIVNLVQLNRMRVTKGLPEIPVGMHMVFAGPPGTGKTTVARLIGDILWEIGYLDSGHVIDVSRHDIVGEYVGWTANMTSKALKAAKGGIFFLDEAYMLSNSESANDFGQEAIDTINKYMEDNRGDMLVIAAGYKDEMVNFMISNPGLKSRFKHELDFKPMDNEQLYAVYEQFCKQYELNLDEEATSLLHKVLHRAHRLGEFHKSNARGVRDMFERMLVKQAQRLAEGSFDLENADLQTIVKQDIYVPETINDGNVTFLSSKKDD